MLIPIPTGMSYSSHVSGTTLKKVRCESCYKHYHYQMERTGIGSGSSLLFLDNTGASQRAQSEATQNLLHQMESTVDVVPCPNCGWYQHDMVMTARKSYLKWMVNVGACLMLGMVPVGVIGNFINTDIGHREPVIPTDYFWLTIGAVALLGVGFIVGKLYLASRYDPNKQDPQTSIALGRQRAILLVEDEPVTQL